ncbi:hypothetical protein B566_EDAN005205 [Ephemera danica]|nr:hypothetical protein B566_EDAN005205 [Ephemera danica]
MLHKMSCENDVHICGVCKEEFGTIESFLEHKSKKCGLSSHGNRVVELSASLNLNEGLGLETSDPHNDKNVAALRDSLLGLAAAAQAEFLESQEAQHDFRSTVDRPSYHRGLNDDEEDVADVLANQLSGMVSAQVLAGYEPTMNPTESQPVTEEYCPRDIVMDIEAMPKVDKKDVYKIMTGPRSKRKDKKPVKKFACTHEGCTFEGRYSKDLVRHVRIHTGERPFDCKVCGYTFNRADKLKAHLRIHTGEKPYKCQTCSYAATDPSSLRKHIRTHTDERPCAAFKTNTDLKRHTKLHTDEKPFSCDLCDFRSRIKGNLTSHMRRAHLGGHKKYTCILCRTFVAHTYTALVQHKKTHINCLQRCNIGKCDYVAATLPAFRYHLRSKHPGECAQLSCKHCSFTCSQNGELRTHLKFEHPEVFKKQSRKSKSDTNSGSRNSKADNIAKAIVFKRNFKCRVCSLSFVRNDSLRAHVKIHEQAAIGRKGVVVVDSLRTDDNPDDPEVVPAATIQPPTTIPEPVSHTVHPISAPQQMLFYVPNVVQSLPQQDHLLLSPNSGNNLLEQLNLQHGVQYILVPSTTAADSFDTQSQSNLYTP